MVFKLYGHPASTTTKLVAVILHEKKMPFEFITVDIYSGENEKPEFLAKNPFGQVPCIVSLSNPSYSLISVSKTQTTISRTTMVSYYMTVALYAVTSTQHTPTKGANLPLLILRDLRYSTKLCSVNFGTLIVFLSLLSSRAFSKSKKIFFFVTLVFPD